MPAGVQLHPSPRAPCFGLSRAGEPKAATSLAGPQNGSSGVAPHLSYQLEKWEADTQRSKRPAQPWGVCLEPVQKLVPQGTTPSSGTSCRAGHVGAVIFLQQGLHSQVPGPRQGWRLLLGRPALPPSRRAGTASLAPPGSCCHSGKSPATGSRTQGAPGDTTGLGISTEAPEEEEPGKCCAARCG